MTEFDNTGRSGDESAARNGQAFDMKRKRSELTKSWSASLIGTGFLWPWEIISRPKRSLLLLLGFFASMVTLGSLFIASKAALFSERGQVTPSLSSLLDPSEFGTVVGAATRNTVQDATTLLTGKDGKRRPIEQLNKAR